MNPSLKIITQNIELSSWFCHFEMDNSSRPSDAVSSEHNASNYFLNQLSPILILTSIFFNFVSRISPAPLTPKIEFDLNLSHTDAGALFFLISLGYIITLIGSGFLSSRLNYKRTIALLSKNFKKSENAHAFSL